MKGGGLAMMVAEKMGEPKDEPTEEGGDMPDGKVTAMEEFHAAMADGDHAAAAKALEAFVSMCRYGGGEEES